MPSHKEGLRKGSEQLGRLRRRTSRRRKRGWREAIVRGKRRYATTLSYVALITFSEQGLRNAKETVQRAHRFRADLERRGRRFVSEYWTLGPYDIPDTFEALDDQTAMAALLALGSLSNARTETLRAFIEPETECILQKV